MESDTRPNPLRGLSPAFTYWSSLYAIVVGVIYGWAYWSGFSINILQFLSLSDVVKHAALPVATWTVFVLAGLFLGAVRPLPFKSPPSEAAVQKFSKVWPYLKAGYVIGVVVLIVWEPPRIWLVLPLLIATPVGFTLSQGAYFKSLLPSRFGDTLLVALIAVPLYAYGIGNVQAASIVDGTRYTYIIADGSDGLPFRDQPRYLGIAGGYVFMYMPKERMVRVAAMSEVKAINLKSHLQLMREVR